MARKNKGTMEPPAATGQDVAEAGRGQLADSLAGQPIDTDQTPGTLPRGSRMPVFEFPMARGTAAITIVAYSRGTRRGQRATVTVDGISKPFVFEDETPNAGRRPKKLNKKSGEDNKKHKPPLQVSDEGKFSLDVKLQHHIKGKGWAESPCGEIVQADDANARVYRSEETTVIVSWH